MGNTTAEHTPTPKDVIYSHGWLHNEDTGRIPQRYVINFMEEYATLKNAALQKRIAECEEEKTELLWALNKCNSFFSAVQIMDHDKDAGQRVLNILVKSNTGVTG